VLWRQQRQRFAREIARMYARPRRLSDDYVAWAGLAGHHADFLRGNDGAAYPLWCALNLERWLEELSAPRAARAS
jgi:hypothetical protein